MTQEQKNLLMRDLCARLPYGIICEDGYGNVLELIGIEIPNTATFKCSDKTFCTTDLDKCKPCLYPLSSMTEDQRNEYNSLKREVPVFHYEYGDIVEEVDLCETVESIDYLYKNHFDCNDLIPLGLAIDATNLNIY